MDLDSESDHCRTFMGGAEGGRCLNCTLLHTISLHEPGGLLKLIVAPKHCKEGATLGGCEVGWNPSADNLVPWFNS